VLGRELRSYPWVSKYILDGIHLECQIWLLLLFGMDEESHIFTDDDDDEEEEEDHIE